MNGSTDWLAIALNWMPMILIIGVWFYFCVYRMSKGPVSAYQKECLDLTRRQVEALERIVQLPEKKNAP
ncbi:MAG: hypothetical protein ABSD74_08875 [Rhizomicrobium sp.]|jgi:ATP-dependent Zn protease